VVYVLFMLGLLFLWLALHPFTTYPLSLWLVRRFRRIPQARPLPAPSGQGISICMCAYNEERVIEAKIDNLLALQAAYPGLELNVYVDAASDRTAELLRAHSDRIRLVISPTRQGKTYGMNRLVEQSTQPILIFTDANVMIDLEAPARILQHFVDPEVGCVCAHLSYTNAGDSVTAGSGALYWRLEEWIKGLETQTGSAMGADGSLFAIRRALHRAPPDHIIDDMFVSFSVLCDGYRVVQATDVNAFEESVTATHEEFGRKVRIACQAFNVHRLLWPRLRKLGPLDLYKYVSHKLLRWLAIYLLVLGFASIELGLWAADLASWAGLLAVASLAFAVVGSRGWLRPIAQLWDMLTAFAGTGLGVFKSIQGAKYQTWTPAASIRK
jgi:cellulose synthase/poly-beta-1,6-N-acetylglucosamine synthase-like glycosyltransferase